MKTHEWLIAGLILIVLSAICAHRICLGAGSYEKILANRDPSDIPTAQEWCKWAVQCKMQGDMKGMARCEREAGDEIHRLMKMPDKNMPEPASRLLICLARHHACCENWSKVAECYDLALNEFYPKHPESLKRDSGRMGPAVFTAVLRQERAEAWLKMNKPAAARRDLQKTLADLDRMKPDSIPQTLPPAMFTRIKETVRLTLAEAAEQQGKSQEARELYARIQAGYKQAGPALSPFDTKRLSAGLARVGLKENSAQDMKLNQPVTGGAAGATANGEEASATDGGCCGGENSQPAAITMAASVKTAKTTASDATGEAAGATVLAAHDPPTTATASGCGCGGPARAPASKPADAPTTATAGSCCGG